MLLKEDLGFFWSLQFVLHSAEEWLLWVGTANRGCVSRGTGVFTQSSTLCCLCQGLAEYNPLNFSFSTLKNCWSALPLKSIQIFILHSYKWGVWKTENVLKSFFFFFSFTCVWGFAAGDWDTVYEERCLPHGHVLWKSGGSRQMDRHVIRAQVFLWVWYFFVVLHGFLCLPNPPKTF